MNLKKFKTEWHNAPMSIFDFAEAAAEVEDSIPLRKAAEDLLSAQEAFVDALDDISVEIG
jgi:hypothetical protein